MFADHVAGEPPDIGGVVLVAAAAVVGMAGRSDTAGRTEPSGDSPDDVPEERDDSIEEYLSR